MMKSWIAILLLCLASLVHAAPGDVVTDGAEPQATEKGLISRLGDQLKQARDNVGERATQLVGNAMGFLGVPYKFGGTSVESGGFDCSGFVRAVYEESIGKVLPRRASEQAAATQTIDRTDLKPGDLVFFNTMRRAFSHVGIYLGDGKFIHSPRTGSSVRVDDMRESYWQKRFNGARRVLPAPMEATTPAPAVTQ